MEACTRLPWILTILESKPFWDCDESYRDAEDICIHFLGFIEPMGDPWTSDKEAFAEV